MLHNPFTIASIQPSNRVSAVHGDVVQRLVAQRTEHDEVMRELEVGAVSGHEERELSSIIRADADNRLLVAAHHAVSTPHLNRNNLWAFPLRLDINSFVIRDDRTALDEDVGDDDVAINIDKDRLASVQLADEDEDGGRIVCTARIKQLRRVRPELARTHLVEPTDVEVMIL